MTSDSIYSEKKSKRFDLTQEQLNLALLAPGQGALAGLAALLQELEDVVGVEAISKVRLAAIEAMRRTGLPDELVDWLSRTMDAV